MKNLAKRIVMLSIAMMMLGCAPPPDEVCKHLENVYSNYDDKPGYMRSQEHCKESFLLKKKQHGVNSYRREVECLLGADKMFDIRACSEKEAARVR